MSEAKQCTPERQSRHLEIEDALGGLRSAVEHLDRLRGKIAGEDQPPPETKASERVERSLAAVLEVMPNEITQQSEVIRKLANEIRGLIF